MPEKTRIDPYGFVPLVGEPQRAKVTGHDRFHLGAKSGRLICRLTTKTPLFIYDPQRATQIGGGHERVEFRVSDKVAIIPGSSLKGAIRSIVEAAEPSCLTFPETGTDGSHTYRGSGVTGGQVRVQVPKEFRRCRDTIEVAGHKIPGALCPACRLFGWLHRDAVWAGKVSIGDARSNPGEYALMPFITLGVLSTPKPEARQKTYVQPDREHTIVGRKFYRHRLDPIVSAPPKGRQNKTVQPVGPNSTFTFTVDYTDVTDAELPALLYGLFLEQGLWHKVGMGKPLGLGSVHIQPIRWVLRDPARRYATLGGESVVLEGNALDREVAECVHRYRESKGKPDQPPHLKELRDILQNDHDKDVSYPPPPARPGSQARRVSR